MTCTFQEPKTSTSVIGLEVGLYYKSIKVKTATTNDKGQCVFYDLKKADYKLKFLNQQDRYEEGPAFISNPSKQNVNHLIYVRWNKEKEEKMLEEANQRDKPILEGIKLSDEDETQREEQLMDWNDGDASFPGGERALANYIARTVRYPQISIIMNEQGRVYMAFIVEPDGSIDAIKVERGVSADLDREARLLIEYMPNWLPGKIDEEAVRTLCRLPINFTLN